MDGVKLMVGVVVPDLEAAREAERGVRVRDITVGVTVAEAVAGTQDEPVSTKPGEQMKQDDVPPLPQPAFCVR